MPGLFIIGCFISVSMGTSMGTIGALAPIAVQISEKTGFSMAICIGAVMCGAMFGDNLSMISDTTIAAVKTQGCEMKDKFRENFLIVLPAAILTVVIFFLLTRNARFDLSTQLDYNLLQVLPYLVVLVGALIGIICISAGTSLPRGRGYWNHRSRSDVPDGASRSGTPAAASDSSSYDAITAFTRWPVSWALAGEMGWLTLSLSSFVQRADPVGSEENGIRRF
ncbi:MAG: Na+/H+ antiporter NhaC family protein [Lachnospiraceae bacterium]